MTYTSRSLQTLKAMVFSGSVYVAAVDAVVELVMMSALICFSACIDGLLALSLPSAFNVSKAWLAFP